MKYAAVSSSASAISAPRRLPATNSVVESASAAVEDGLSTVTLARSVWTGSPVRGSRMCQYVTPSCSNTRSYRPLVTSDPPWTRAVPTTVSPSGSLGSRTPVSQGSPFGFSPNSAILPPSESTAPVALVSSRSRSQRRSATYPLAMPPKSSLACGSARRTVSASSSISMQRQPTWGRASAIASGAGRTPSVKSQSVETAPIVTSNRPSACPQYVLAASRRSTVSACTRTGSPAAALMRAISDFSS